MRPLWLHPLIALCLLLQGLATAWALPMPLTAPSEQPSLAAASDHEADDAALPPCHREASAIVPAAPEPARDAAGCPAGFCHCAALCNVLSAAALPPAIPAVTLPAASLTVFHAVPLPDSAAPLHERLRPPISSTRV